MQVDIAVDHISETMVEGAREIRASGPYLRLVETNIVQAVLVGRRPHVYQILLEQASTMEQQRELVFTFLDAECGIVGPRKSLSVVGGLCEIVVVTILAENEEERVLQALIHRGPLVYPLEGPISLVKHNVTGARLLSPISRDNSSNLIGCGEVVSSMVLVLVDREPQGHVVGVRRLEDFVCLFEDSGPMVVLGDKATQAIHHIGVQATVSLHSVV